MKIKRKKKIRNKKKRAEIHLNLKSDVIIPPSLNKSMKSFINLI